MYNNNDHTTTSPPLIHPCPDKTSRNNGNPTTPRLGNDTATQPFQTQATQPHLPLLDLGNLIDMFERDLAHHLFPRIHRAANLPFALLDAGRLQQEIRRRRRPQLEMKTPIRSYRYPRRNRYPWRYV